MSTPPASPRAARLAAPTWLDGRLVLGVLLVLVSVVVGARVLATADRSQRVWVATHDLAPGSTLSAGDLRPGKVRLFDTGSRYLVATGRSLAGYVLTRGVGAGELLPRGGLRAPGEAPGDPLREVSVPVDAGHLPEDLQAGQQVDVYVTPGATTASTTPSANGAPSSGAAAPLSGGTRRVLAAVPVRLRPRDTSVAASRVSAVVLSVDAAQADELVSAVQGGKLDLVRVPRDSEVAPLPAAAAGH